MKRIVVWSGLVFLVLLAIFGIARADGWRHHGWGGRAWGMYGPVGYINHELHLSDAQRAQIHTLWQSERPTVSSLIKELVSEGKEMDTATTRGADDSQIREIASRQGATITKLLIEKQHFKASVYSQVLTQEQRARAAELEKEWSSHLDRFADRIGSKDDTLHW
ncbi:periplasmic heavy metal sensor [Terriglobus albidus]|uniref:Periplasmic heavy metal sensor n=1 Tax=Terriglobus albidus TaxID=1592106 RepID=A0A5B9EA30_9BACT|nr:Spy/CpxP family protein refolding chaperone [Terriglobus albidus]QEE26966.1 periplasmic heavy metal sensor [Terriglobus albidus]